MGKLEKAVYEDKEKGISFVPNPENHWAYDVFIRKDHFYIPDRIIPGLASLEMSTSDVRASLEAMNPRIRYILQNNRITYEEFHIALLKVRNMEVENEISTILSHGL